MEVEQDHLPLVTVVIPCRNEAGEIGRAIAAVLQQEYPLEQMEVVVVEGDSSDGTAQEAAAALEASGLRRWAVLSNVGGSTPSNLNRGLAWANGSIVVRVDARSHVPRGYVGRVVARLRHPEVTVVGGRQVAISRGTGPVDVGIARALNNRFGMGLSRYRRGSTVGGPVETVYLGAFRRQQLLEAGGWDPSLPTNQDFELNRRLGRRGFVWLEPDLAVGYVPRRELLELFHQYHRFGRWKVRYWRVTADRPRPRQLLLLCAPPIAATAGGVAAAIVGLPTLLVAAVAGVVVEHVGCGGPAGGPRSRVVSLAAMAAVGLGWWTGVSREWLLPSRVRPATTTAPETSSAPTGPR